MTEPVAKLKLKYGEIEFEIEGNSEIVQREREEFQKSLISAIEVLSRKMYTRPISTETFTSVDTEILGQNTQLITCASQSEINKYSSFNQLVKDKKFNTDVDKVIGAAYFIEFCQNKESFTKNDILEQFKKAKLKTPSNVSTCISENVKKAFIHNVGSAEKGLQLYSILEDGMTYCENYEPKDVVIKAKKTTKKTKPAKDYPILSVNVDALNIGKYCDITKLKKFPEQVWVLLHMYTKETEYNTFTKNEIQRIMKEKFNLPAGDKQIRNFFDRAGKDVDKNKINGEWTLKLMQGGFQKAEEIINKNKS